MNSDITKIAFSIASVRTEDRNQLLRNKNQDCSTTVVSCDLTIRIYLFIENFVKLYQIQDYNNTVGSRFATGLRSRLFGCKSNRRSWTKQISQIIV